MPKGLDKYGWYVGSMSRYSAESLLKSGRKEGCFVVRISSKDCYTLSLYTKVPHSRFKHCEIKQNSRSECYLFETRFESIPDLIKHYRNHSGGLGCRLKCSPGFLAGADDDWEIHRSDIKLYEELGAGSFGVVKHGKWCGEADIAVKIMIPGTMSEDAFIKEAAVMTNLEHKNVVQLYGICSKTRPIYIVTEYMKHGSLLQYIKNHEQSLTWNQSLLLDICYQVSKGMAYLERHNCVHRDLAARNCLVGSKKVVKVADFGLARFVLDDQYRSGSSGSKFPIRWSPPEVLSSQIFSSKSDVWSFGVLMWEVFTFGIVPYAELNNTDVIELVKRGTILERPKSCSREIYKIMKNCWEYSPDYRPSFRRITSNWSLNLAMNELRI